MWSRPQSRCGLLWNVSSPDQAGDVTTTRQEMSRRPGRRCPDVTQQPAEVPGFGTTDRFLPVFSLLYLILKGDVVGCCNQWSWSGSDLSQDIYCSRQEISLSTLLSLSILSLSGTELWESPRVGVFRRWRSVSQFVSWSLNVERWAPRNLTMGIT